MSELAATAAMFAFAARYLFRRVFEVLLMISIAFGISGAIAFFLWLARTFATA